MRITLSDAGKRFNRDWIFRHFNYELISGQSYAIIGPNGAGKSTLLQVLSGAMGLNEGKISYFDDRKLLAINENKTLPATPTPPLVEVDRIFDYVSICAPYMELIEEMTLKEFLKFHQNFKPFISSLSITSIIAIIGLESAAHKQIRYYSSGMKQRVKLAQCIFSDSQIALLDEPCTNFDTAGIHLYHQLISEYCQNRVVIVSSNDEVEYKFCNEQINILHWK